MVSTFCFNFMVNHKLMAAVLFLPFTFLSFCAGGGGIIQNIFKARAISWHTTKSGELAGRMVDF